MRIGTRGSELALRQAAIVQGLLGQAGVPSWQVVIDTLGDQRQDILLNSPDAEGLFTATLDKALLDGEIDIGVHACKDLPLGLNPALEIIATPPRAYAAEALLLRPGARLEQPLVLGSCSHRRKLQWQARYAHHSVLPVRGSVPHRLQQMDEGEYDGLILAAAGLQRLGLLLRIHSYLPWMLPAPGQGAIAIVARKNDPRLRALKSILNHPATYLEVMTERHVCSALGAHYDSPLGVWAQVMPPGRTLKLQLWYKDHAQQVFRYRQHTLHTQSPARVWQAWLAHTGARPMSYSPLAAH